MLTRKNIELFAKLLDGRLKTGTFMTEDSVRDTCLNAMFSNGICRHTDVVLEKPNPTIEKAKLDAVVTARDNEPSMAFEFKYSRKNPGQTNQPRTQKAGDVFNDVFRLARVPESTAKFTYFVYLTDCEMASYFRNPPSGLRDFFQLREGESFKLTPDFVARRAETFRRRVKTNEIECAATSIFSREIANEHSLRIYEIEA